MKTKLACIVILTLFITSCASYERAPGGYMNGLTLGGSSDEVKQKEDDRMLIYNANITIEAKNADILMSKVVQIAKKYNGYVLRLNKSNTTIRIISDSLNIAIAEIGTYGKVKYRNITGTDVTDEFTDYKIRLENAERSRNRYLELLQKAVTVEEILKVEKELERLNGEIDLLKGKMNRIDHLVSYSTIDVYYQQKVKLGVLGYVFVGSYKAVKWLFVRN